MSCRSHRCLRFPHQHVGQHEHPAAAKGRRSASHKLRAWCYSQTETISFDVAYHMSAVCIDWLCMSQRMSMRLVKNTRCPLL